jgi:Zn-dependent M16 (insulinase) family peptidase
MESAATQSILNYLRGVVPDGNKVLLRNIQQVSKDDLLRALKKYLKPLFDVKQTNVAIATNPSKVADIVASFAEADRKLVEAAAESTPAEEEEDE